MALLGKERVENCPPWESHGGLPAGFFATDISDVLEITPDTLRKYINNIRMGLGEPPRYLLVAEDAARHPLDSYAEQDLESIQLQGLSGMKFFASDLKIPTKSSKETETTASRLQHLELENLELRGRLEYHSPHRRLMRCAAFAQLLFAGTLLLQLVSSADLINPFLAWTGVGVSTCVMVLAFLKSREFRSDAGANS